jgi:long-chain acyl-CoA synthetase
MQETASEPLDERTYLQRLEDIWRARWPAGVPREPRYPLGEMPLTGYLREWARRTPERTAIEFHGRSVTWAQFDRLSDAFAALLQRDGLKPGDRVAVFMSNCPQFHIVFFGILKAGCVHVPVNPMFTEAELVYELNDTQARLLVALEGLVALALKAMPQTTVERLISTSLLDMLPADPAGTLPAGLLERHARPEGVRDLMFELSAIEEPPAPVQESLDALAALNYTGGTTGLPKGCMHTQRDMLYTAAVAGSVCTDIGPQDVIVNYFPVFWVAGEDVGVLFPVVTGATCVLMARWDPMTFIEAVDRNRATVAVMLVDNAVQVMEHPDARPARLGSLRETLVASFVKKLNPSYRALWRERCGATLREAAWGMTETHSFDTFTRGQQQDDADLKARQVFCGLPVPGTAFKVLEFGGERLLPLGEEGELCVRTPSLFGGYWNKPEATAEAIRDGWMRTGDLAMIGEDGFVHFLGRRKEMLKVKGMSVFPAEIEAVLGQHPFVTGSGVVGREDPDRGQVPVAFITVRDSAASSQEISAFCKERLAGYKVPEIRIVDALPMTATGKVRKDELGRLL